MKNLSNFKIIIKTREYLIQAIYQMLFSNDDIQKIITQFKEEHKAVSYTHLTLPTIRSV